MGITTLDKTLNNQSYIISSENCRWLESNTKEGTFIFSWTKSIRCDELKCTICLELTKT